MADPDALRPRRDEGEEDLGRRRVRILVEAVVLDLPDAVVAELVGEHRLLDAVVERPAPRTARRVGDLHLEKIENFTRRRLHACPTGAAPS